MEPKEKAAELIKKFGSKKYALICVEEVLNKDGFNNHYWQKIKQELENL